MYQSFSRAESSHHPHLSPDAAQTLIPEDLHRQAFEDHQLPTAAPHHQAMDDPTGTSIRTGPELSRDPDHRDGIERVQDRSRLDLALHQEDEEADVIALVAMQVEGGEARVIAAIVVMMIEVGAEVGVVEDGEDAKTLGVLSF